MAIQGYIEGLGGKGNGRKYIFENIQSLPAPLWSMKAAIPQGRNNLASSAINGKINVLGGNLTATSQTNKNDCYDPLTDTWSAKTDMPTGRAAHVAIAVNNNIYTIGGVQNTSATNKNDCYDPLTDTWSAKTDMPTPNSYSAAAMFDDKIYLFGGIQGRTKNDCYDPLTDTWSAKTDMPTSGYSRVAAVFDGKIHVIGGSSSSAHDCYDPLTDTWSAKTARPVAGGGSAHAIHGRIYVIGSQSYPIQNDCYDPVTDTWAVVDNSINPRSQFAASTVNNKLFVIGGLTGSSIVRVNECYDVFSGAFVFEIKYRNVLNFDREVCVNGMDIQANSAIEVDTKKGADVIFLHNNTSGTIEPIGEVSITN